MCQAIKTKLVGYGGVEQDGAMLEIYYDYKLCMVTANKVIYCYLNSFNKILLCTTRVKPTQTLDGVLDAPLYNMIYDD